MENRKEILRHFNEQKYLIEDRLNSCIESERKTRCKINLKNADGEPVKGAHVEVKQIKHAFRYGANLFMLDEIPESDKNEEYKRLFRETFNMATLPFYWDGIEPVKGKTRYSKDSEKIYRRPAPDLCIEFCEKYGIEPREHALAYDRFFPEWLYGTSLLECKKAYEKRCSEIAERYGDKIRTIEVTNEMEWARNQVRTELYRQPDFIEYSFKTAEKYFSANQLVINEHTSGVWTNRISYQRGYKCAIENALARGARIDAIGMQFHSFVKSELEETLLPYRYNPYELFYTMDDYAKLGKPLQITEVTIPAYSKNDEDEAIQAEIIENLYKIWFGHPAVEQIIYWNLVDGYAAFAPLGDMTSGENYYHGGLVRFDMTPKPAYYKIKNLFEKVWHTECEAVPEADGGYYFKGFLGDYELAVTYDGKTVTKPIKLDKQNGGIVTYDVTV